MFFCDLQIGTLISALIIGFGLYGVKQGGLLYANIQLSECLAFGSLISAVDPVSTLAVFAELKVMNSA